MKLAELIDLELQLARDRGEPLEKLLDRDAAIGRERRKSRLDGRALYLAWLAALFPVIGFAFSTESEPALARRRAHPRPGPVYTPAPSMASLMRSARRMYRLPTNHQ